MGVKDGKPVGNVFEEFRWRGMIHPSPEGAEHFSPGLPELLARESVVGYIGFHPTADSLHAGSLLPVIALVHLQKHGHTPIAIVGGGTALIGDHCGKEGERPLL